VRGKNCNCNIIDKTKNVRSRNPVCGRERGERRQDWETATERAEKEEELLLLKIATNRQSKKKANKKQSSKKKRKKKR